MRSVHSLITASVGAVMFVAVAVFDGRRIKSDRTAVSRSPALREGRQLLLADVLGVTRDSERSDDVLSVTAGKDEVNLIVALEISTIAFDSHAVTG